MFLFNLIKLIIVFRGFKFVYIMYNVFIKLMYFSYVKNKYKCIALNQTETF